PINVRAHASVAGADGRIYVIGGLDDTNNVVSNNVYAYTIATDTWAALASLPTARSMLGAAVGSNGRIYAIGGAEAGTTTTVEAFDGAAWSTAHSLTNARTGPVVIAGSDGR